MLAVNKKDPSFRCSVAATASFEGGQMAGGQWQEVKQQKRGSKRKGEVQRGERWWEMAAKPFMADVIRSNQLNPRTVQFGTVADPCDP
jgi:hypothetical protein